jgi:hypothetical protein
MDVLPVRPVDAFAESNRTRGGRKNRKALSNLREAIHSPVYQVKNWATPDASDRRSDKSRQVGLSNQTKTWPTPASSGVTGGPTGLAGGAGNREKLASMLPDAEARAMGCGKLNPRWVETLMGLPVGWTMPSCASPVTIERMNSDSLVTVLSRQQQNEPSEA